MKQQQRTAGFGASLVFDALALHVLILPTGIHRSWASDSGPGKHQDMWVPYEPHVCLRLETARKQGEQTIELDPDSPGVRHIDLTDPANIKQR